MNAARHWAPSHMGAAVNVSESSFSRFSPTTTTTSLPTAPPPTHAPLYTPTNQRWQATHKTDRRTDRQTDHATGCQSSVGRRGGSLGGFAGLEVKCQQALQNSDKIFNFWGVCKYLSHLIGGAGCNVVVCPPSPLIYELEW